MLITINDQPITLGMSLDDETIDRAELKRTGRLRWLLSGGGTGTACFEAVNCSVECFEGAFNLYPCIEHYLTPDRQWRTAAKIVLSKGKVTSAVVRVIEGRYAASEFVDRFLESCRNALGAPQEDTGHSTRWRAGQAEITATLLPDAQNASIRFTETSADRV